MGNWGKKKIVEYFLGLLMVSSVIYRVEVGLRFFVGRNNEKS